MRTHINEELCENLISFYKSRPVGLECVAEKFGLCSITVSRILKRNNIPLWSKTLIYNPDLNEHFFENIDSEHKAYFVGMIIADGNVFDPVNSKHHGEKWVSITLQDEDSYMLEEFRKDIGLSSIVASDGRGSSCVAARSDIMANYLEKYGIVPRKSFNTRFPFEIDSKFYRHVIRGIFDGDGSIHVGKYRTREGRIKNRHKMSFCGTKRLMDELVSTIMEQTKIKTCPHVYSYKTRCLSEFRISNIEDMYEFGKWLYEDSTIFMKRKHDKFDSFVTKFNLKPVPVNPCFTME